MLSDYGDPVLVLVWVFVDQFLILKGPSICGLSDLMDTRFKSSLVGSSDSITNRTLLLQLGIYFILLIWGRRFELRIFTFVETCVYVKK